MTGTQKWLILRVCEIQRFLKFFNFDDGGGGGEETGNRQVLK